MLKAMLVVTALASGGGDYNVEMPSMKECLDARITIAEQDPNVKTLCVRIADDSKKMEEILDSFMDLIDIIKEEEEIRMEFPMEKYVCDNSLQPGIVIFTSPPRINCNELPKSPLWLPKPDWKPDWKE